jgi:hypothetical protein
MEEAKKYLEEASIAHNTMTRLEALEKDKLNAYGGGFELTVESEEL